MNLGHGVLMGSPEARVAHLSEITKMVQDRLYVPPQLTHDSGAWGAGGNALGKRGALLGGREGSSDPGPSFSCLPNRLRP